MHSRQTLRPRKYSAKHQASSSEESQLHRQTHRNKSPLLIHLLGLAARIVIYECIVYIYMIIESDNYRIASKWWSMHAWQTVHSQTHSQEQANCFKESQLHQRLGTEQQTARKWEGKFSTMQARQKLNTRKSSAKQQASCSKESQLQGPTQR